jgi:hypothetical protein
LQGKIRAKVIITAVFDLAQSLSGIGRYLLALAGQSLFRGGLLHLPWWPRPNGTNRSGRGPFTFRVTLRVPRGADGERRRASTEPPPVHGHNIANRRPSFGRLLGGTIMANAGLK